MNELDVVTFGEAMAMFVADEAGDLSAVTHWTKRPAGAELNVAIGLSRLGFRVGWVSRFGADSFGKYLADVLDGEGIDRRGVRIDERRPTGFQLKSGLEGDRDPVVEYFRRGSAASFLSVEDYVPAYFEGARHLHLTGVGPALSPSAYELASHAAERMREAGRSISFDPNLRPVLWPTREAMVEGLNRLAAKSDVVLPGIGEGLILVGREEPDAIADFYLERGASLVVIKLGALGAFVKSATVRAAVPGVKVPRVVDTVGAGDGFAVGLLSALLEGASPERAAARGNAVAARVIQYVGDSEGLPTRQELGLARAAAEAST